MIKDGKPHVDTLQKKEEKEALQETQFEEIRVHRDFPMREVQTAGLLKKFAL